MCIVVDVTDGPPVKIEDVIEVSVAGEAVVTPVVMTDVGVADVAKITVAGVVDVLTPVTEEVVSSPFLPTTVVAEAVSHRRPSQSTVQVQTYPFSPSTQVPPFKQGLLAHSSMFIEHKRPVKPAKQLQVKEPKVLIQVL